MVSLTEMLAVQWSFLTALGRIHFLSLSLSFFFFFLFLDMSVCSCPHSLANTSLPSSEPAVVSKVSHPDSASPASLVHIIRAV